MKKQKQLLLGRNIFIFIVFVLLGVIVTIEKAGGLLIPKAKEKIEKYIEKEYKEEKQNFEFGKVTFKDSVYTMKVMSKQNNNYYFLINYSKKKITDTYKEDYIKGKTFLKRIKKNLQKEITKKTNTPCEIEIISTLDEYTSQVQKRIILEEDLINLKFYNIKKDILIEWNSKSITQKLIEEINKYNEQNITPKYYIFTITNKKDVTESIELKLTTEFLNNNNQETIINDIIHNNNSKLLEESNITYKYLN